MKVNRAWRYYLGLTKLARRRLVVSTLLLISKSFIYVPIVVLVRYAFDSAIPNGDWNGLLFYAGAVIAFLFLISLVGIWARRQALTASKTILKQLRYDLLSRFTRFSREKYTNTDLQRLRFSLMVETDRLEGMNYAVLTQIMPGLISGIVLIAILVSLNALLVLIFFLLLPFLAAFAYFFRRRVAAYHQNFLDKFQRLSADINQMLNLLDLIHIQSAEAAELEHRREGIEVANDASEGLWFQRMLFTEFQYFALFLVIVLVFLAGSWTVIQGSMPSGDLASFYMVLGLLISLLRPIWSSYPLMITGNASLKHLHEILEDPDEQPYSGSRIIPFAGRISLRDVKFGYGERPILDHFDLEIHPGKKIAILGPNGAGKTTLLHLILGFYRPWEGQVLVEGVPLEEVDIIDLRRRIGVMSQDSQLWPGSLWENLTYGNTMLPREDVLEACRLAMVDEFIDELEDGYDTLIGEKGVLLSGGQRQRVEIARALVRRPKLLILDEVTNHLDQNAGDQILKSLTSLPYDPAILFITHDRRILAYVDQVIEFQPLENSQNGYRNLVSLSD